MNSPFNRQYTERHIWLKAESGGEFSVGVTFHAQEQLGDVVFVEPPAVGRTVTQDEACGVIESVKTAADIHTPVSGEVVAVNDALADAPEAVNSAPYDTWLFRIKPADSAQLAALLDAAAYDQFAARDS